MDFTRVTKDNIEKEHICCAISDNKDIQVSSKKAWLKDRFDDGLVFLKGSERGKCFIEYLPAENAWNPIDANGYTYIDCLWVSGSLSGHGYSNTLLNTCINDSRSVGARGLCILSSAQKRTFLADPKYLKSKGFLVADEADNGVQLWYLPFSIDETAPKFFECAKHPHTEYSGFALYYTNQCPYTAKYVPVIKEIADARGIDFRVIHLETKEQARKAPTPITTYALFKDGNYLSNEILSAKKFQKLLGI